MIADIQQISVTLLLLQLVPVASVSVSVVSNIPRSDVTCWTCPLHSSNEECNNWAPNLACPEHNTVCQTFHTFNASTGETFTVEKSCVSPNVCSSNHVGCEKTADGTMKCTSCCTTSLCNEDVPTDQDTAINLSSVFSSSDPLLSYNYGLVVWISIFVSKIVREH